eukprot:scaffold527150_cov47-Prasinocladus_malaysianus.AAC.1
MSTTNNNDRLNSPQLFTVHKFRRRHAAYCMCALTKERDGLGEAHEPLLGAPESRVPCVY